MGLRIPGATDEVSTTECCVTIQMTQCFLFGFSPILLPHKKQCPPVGFKSLAPVHSTCLCLATPNLLWKATPLEKSMVAKMNDLTMLGKKSFFKKQIRHLWNAA